MHRLNLTGTGIAALALLLLPLPLPWGEGRGERTTPPSTHDGRVNLADCRLEHPDRLQSVAARCTTITVPENRDDPHSRLIQLHVAVVPALDRNGPRDPLFVLAGGPGQGAADFYTLVAPAFARVQRERDIVLVDQRGTGSSNPLNCKYPDEDEAAELSPQEIQGYARSCLESLRSDPRFYTTSAAVRDLDAVRAALGYERINLYGVSYGTRVAQHYVRHFSAHARAVILDGVVPPEQILAVDSALQAQRALDAIFARCQAEPACHAAFPDPAGQFNTLRRELAKSPGRVTFADPVNGTLTNMDVGLGHLQIATRLLSYGSERAAILPLVINEAVARHNLAPLAAQARMVVDRYADTLSYGMHNAVVCTEDVPFFNPADIDRVALERSYLGSVQLDGLIEVCKVWPRGVIDADFHAPLISAVPMLLLSGSADPVTPPSYAERAMRTLAQARSIVLDGQGHGQLAKGCIPKLMASFLSKGSVRALDVSCATQLSPEPFFTTFAGPAP